MSPYNATEFVLCRRFYYEICSQFYGLFISAAIFNVLIISSDIGIPIILIITETLLSLYYEFSNQHDNIFILKWSTEHTFLHFIPKAAPDTMKISYLMLNIYITCSTIKCIFG